MGFSLQKGEKGGIISPVYAAGPASGVQREGGNSMGSFQSWLDQLNYEKLLELAITLVAAMVCIIPHEVSHGYAAYRLGDPTAKNAGRLTMNPLRHIDPVGLLVMAVAHFGWAKPVPIQPGYFKHIRRDTAITALAGPVANVAITMLALMLYSVIIGLSAFRIWPCSTCCPFRPWMGLRFYFPSCPGNTTASCCSMSAMAFFCWRSFYGLAYWTGR